MSTTNSALPKDSRAANIVGAIVSGLAIGYFAAWVRESGNMPSGEYAAFMFLAACSYVVVALLMPQTGRGITRRIPRWVLIAVLGAVLTFIAINFVGDLRHISSFQVNSILTFITAAAGEIERLTVNVLVFSLMALPIMCITHYLGRGLVTPGRKGSRAG